MPRPHGPFIENLEMLELLLFADSEEFVARGFELEESPGVREINRTLILPEVANDERTTRERSPDS